MQVLISEARPAAALFMKSGSARKGRAIETRSAAPLGEDSSGDIRHVDAVGSNDRQRHDLLEAGDRVAPGPAWYRVGDGRHARFVPANAGVFKISAPAASTARAN